MTFIPERLVMIRESKGITKAEAARRLNMTAMCYGRYEKGERTPSYQTMFYIAQRFNTTVEYLCGETISDEPDTIIIHAGDNPELYALVSDMQKDDDAMIRRMLEYYRSISH